VSGEDPGRVTTLLSLALLRQLVLLDQQTLNSKPAAKGQSCVIVRRLSRQWNSGRVEETNERDEISKRFGINLWAPEHPKTADNSKLWTYLGRKATPKSA
jgi:hypothetical protein